MLVVLSTPASEKRFPKVKDSCQEKSRLECANGRTVLSENVRWYTIRTEHLGAGDRELLIRERLRRGSEIRE